MSLVESELAAKLSKRMQLNGESTGNGAVIPLAPHNPPPSPLTKPQSVDAISDSASDDLKWRLNRRQDLNDGKIAPLAVGESSMYAEFFELPRAQLKGLSATFRQFDVDGDGRLNLAELKRMMEILGVPQTHLGLKAMMVEADGDGDGALSFREFLHIFRKAAASELCPDSPLAAFAASVDVAVAGVGGAKDFFEISAQTAKCRFESEFAEEKEAARRAADEKAARRHDFAQIRANFKPAE